MDTDFNGALLGMVPKSDSGSDPQGLVDVRWILVMVKRLPCGQGIRGSYLTSHTKEVSQL